MTNNLVKRLRESDVDGLYGLRSIDWMREAADRIEKLEAALRTIYECCDETGNCSVVRRIVRKALEGKDV